MLHVLNSAHPGLTVKVLSVLKVFAVQEGIDGSSVICLAL